jgi:hypothetical protein
MKLRSRRIDPENRSDQENRIDPENRIGQDLNSFQKLERNLS